MVQGLACDQTGHVFDRYDIYMAGQLDRPKKAESDKTNRSIQKLVETIHSRHPIRLMSLLPWTWIWADQVVMSSPDPDRAHTDKSLGGHLLFMSTTDDVSSFDTRLRSFPYLSHLPVLVFIDMYSIYQAALVSFFWPFHHLLFMYKLQV